ncbi:MAG TPA: two-component regulator propeller domain-containing protein, partial [Blastocatellia bacterium]|nr:two-component regulator propeller domain-containing protein [Blastocatellia bacterium]
MHKWRVVRFNLISGWLWLCLLFAPAQAQHRLDHWTAENGLPQNLVRDLVQTRDGYLWMTTHGGLVRFDGQRFTVFSKITNPEITTNRLTFLHEDRAGRLWIGTEGDGVLCYQDGVFTRWSDQNGLPGSQVDFFDEDETGAVLVFTEQGAAQWRDGKFVALPLRQQTDRQTVQQTAKQTDRRGAAKPQLIRYNRYLSFVLQLADNGYRFFHRGRWENLPNPPGVPAGAALPIGAGTLSITGDMRGRLWFRWRNVSGYYEKRGGRWEVTLTPTLRGNPFYLDARGRYWTVYQTGVWLEKDGMATPLQVQGVNWAYRVLEDREGNLWLGTYDQGVYRLIEQTISSPALPGRPTERYVYPLLEDRSGNVWISAGESGLTRYSNGQFKRFSLPGAKLPQDISSLYEDTDGSLIVGTYLYGLTRFQNGQWSRDAELSARINERVDVIFRDRQGDLWFGGRNGLDRRSFAGQWTHYNPDNGLPTKHVKTILEDSSGRLWIGGYGCLALWNNGRFITWTKNEGLVADRVISLYEDRDHFLWIGTPDGGLYRLQLNGADWRLTHYTTRDGLYSNWINQIFEDERGYFWIGSEQGIFRLHKQELHDFAEGRQRFVTSISFGKVDGMVSVECIGGFQPAGFKARDGRFWFPTQDGVAIVDPRQVTKNSLPPPVALEECLLDRRSVDWRQGVQIQPGQSSLEINYTGLSFHKTARVRFRYRLEGLENDWIEAGTRRTAYYSHLPSGNYTFRVIAANSDGVWNTEGRSLRISVIPPVYRRWWFVLCVVALMAGLVTLAFQYRIRQLRRVQLAQQQFSQQLIESQEAERKRIAAELHDSLGQNLIVIKNWATLGKTMTEADAPVNDQLEIISTTAVQSLNEVRAIIHNLRPHQLETIGLAKTLHFMLQQVSAASGIDFTSEITPLDKLFAPEDEVIIYRLVQECVSNIVKHSQATTARLSLTVSDGQLHISIADNGRGMVKTERGIRNAESAASTNLQSGGFGLKGLA